jgi:hypothetical protein
MLMGKFQRRAGHVMKTGALWRGFGWSGRRGEAAKIKFP